ncbi:MAG: 4Fe-4S dicluster-binding protein [Chloroflexota bacterium]|nr:4Fe-4S dicluster-binding protein [Chloroflexota bacterium]
MNDSKRDLLRQIASKLTFADSDTLLKLLDILLSEEEARWIVALPATPKQLAARLNENEERIEAGLHNLFVRGLVFISEHTEQGPRYIADDNPGRFMDMILFDPRYGHLGTGFFDLWRDFFNEELVHAPRSPDKLPFRVIPVEEKIEEQRGILPYERVAELVKQARRIVVQECPCRVRERECDAPLETCIALDNVADYVLSRQIGREIDVDEALAILRQAEELGLVHEVENTDQPTVICACCPCCCVFLRAITRYQKEYVVAKSRYRASIDREKCAQCATCLERCHFGAIRREESGMMVDPELCFGCGLCSSTCPNGAITLIEVREAEHIPIAKETFLHGIDGVPKPQAETRRESTTGDNKSAKRHT